VYAALKEWRRRRAGQDGVPAYVVFHDTTLTDIARAAPTTLAALASVSGVGPTKLQRYGSELLGVLQRELTD
ncbi:MAG: HRDC domain-containing protein, partial [Actinomycetota bacterium]